MIYVPEASRGCVRARLALLLGCAAIGLAAGGGPATAQSLEEAMARAYATNPTLEAQRAQVRATDELVPQALGGYRPRVEATITQGLQRRSIEAGGAETSATTSPTSLGIELNQPIWNGGSTAASIRQAENQVEAQRANLLATEQEVLLDVATAYVDVVRDQAVVELNVANVQVLQRQLDAARDRFQVGELTRTDVSLAEARVARALADRIQAEGRLRASRAAFARIVGEVPGTLEAPTPKFLLPTSLEEAVALAESNNPAVVATQFVSEAATANVERIRGEMRPQVGVSAGLTRGYDTQQLDRVDTASVVASVTIPIYQGGVVAARVREAKHTVARQRLETDAAQRQARETAIRAWEALTTARAAIESLQAQIRAAEIALEGVRQEALVGARTTLDVLDTEQELLDARVGLVAAQRDEVAAAFQVLAATGQLNARQLGLPVEYYDFEPHYRAVRDQWWGTEIRD